MKVDLVSLTVPEGLDMTPEQFIVHVARVSNPENQMNVETSERLIRYLIKHAHWSPFEFVDMTVKIVTRRSIAAQILRHKSFSFQEFSQRYSVATEIEPIELRLQADKNRQSSADTITSPILEEMIEKSIDIAITTYNLMIRNGVAREVARDVLPLATQTTLYMKGSVRSWIHYLQLRMDQTTQKEHRLIAEAIYNIFCEKFPTIAEIINPSATDN
jgi:thymidylate synthase (FAD)